MCAMCGFSSCTNEKTCTWVCQKCNRRVPGALGFGPPCDCPGAWKKTRENLDRLTGISANNSMRRALEDDKRR